MKPHIKEIMSTGKQVVDSMDSYYKIRKHESTVSGLIVGAVIAILAIVFFLIIFVPVVRASQVLKASWYSEASLKKEGTWRISHGIQANGKKFDETKFTCATRLFPMGSRLRVRNLSNGKTCIVVVSDRIGKRFARERIDLSKISFMQISNLKEGLINVIVEVIR